MGFLVMDLEVELPVSNWDDARAGKNGVSVMCTYDMDADLYSFFDRHNMSSGIAQLETADCLVTFNGREFDIPCLEGSQSSKVALQSHFDILQEVWRAYGGQKFKGNGLGLICERTLGLSKLGSGVRAPELWSQGRLAELYSYCLHDVYLTKTLFSHIMDFGYIIDTEGEKLPIETEQFLGA